MFKNFNPPLLLFLLCLLRVSVEEQIGHDLPGQLTRNDSTETQNLAGQEPPHQTDGLVSLVVARDRNIDKLGW